MVFHECRIFGLKGLGYLLPSKAPTRLMLGVLRQSLHLLIHPAVVLGHFFEFRGKVVYFHLKCICLDEAALEALNFLHRIPQ